MKDQKVNQNIPRLLTVKDCAEFIQVTEETIRRYCRTGKLKSIKIGGQRSIRITSVDLFKFLRGNEKGGKR